MIPIRIRNSACVGRGACADKRFMETSLAFTTATIRMRFPNCERTIPVLSRDESIGTSFLIAIVLSVSIRAVFFTTGTPVSAASADEPSSGASPVHMAPCAQGTSKERGLVEHYRGKPGVLPRRT